MSRINNQIIPYDQSYWKRSRKLLWYEITGISYAGANHVATADTVVDEGSKD